MNVTHNALSGLVGAKKDLQVKLYPNGECAVYKAKGYVPEGVRPYEQTEQTIETMRIFRMMCKTPELFQYAPLLLGLSPLWNFDIANKRLAIVNEDGHPPTVQYGRNGITSYGARRVRNAAYLLQEQFGKFRCVFATATLPDLPLEQMELIHRRFNQVVDHYRLGLKRLLQDKGLSGEIVGVTEVQEKRYERTGIPVLHIHSVFVGKDASGKWAISPQAHDDIWRRALGVAIGYEPPELTSACNLSRVRKDAESYLGKYMTKGVASVGRIISGGFSGWLPKQWWSCSRSLSQRVDAGTIQADDFAECLLESMESDGSGLWIWHRKIELVKDGGEKITIAYYGKLRRETVQGIRAYYAS
jgi:hypothetical protein